MTLKLPNVVAVILVLMVRKGTFRGRAAVMLQASRRAAVDAEMGDVSCLSWPRVLLVVPGEAKSSSCRKGASCSHVLWNYHLTSEHSLSNTFEAERQIQGSYSKDSRILLGKQHVGRTSSSVTTT